LVLGQYDSSSLILANLQFMDETFDAVLDKGGLDALMEPELGPKLGNQYLSEVSWSFI
jgi:hypothetical protein